MTEISSIRTDLISQKVLQCLHMMDIDAYPVNPRALVKNLFKKSKGKIPVLLETYSSYSDFLGKSVEELIISPFNSSEGATVYLQDMHLYAIFYNDTVGVSGRINWTIAHELGHVMLDHYQFMDPIVFDSIPKPAESAAILEKEADMFAKYLLCHPLVLAACSLYDPIMAAKTCRISKEAAANTAKESKKANHNHHYGSWDKAIVKNFSQFIHTYKCSICHKIFTAADTDAAFCPVCGSTRISWYNGAQKRYQKEYGSSAISVCPSCSAPLNETNGTLCAACKKDISNRCTNPECGKTLLQDFRYCQICGYKSAYFSQNLISAWKF